MAKNETKKAAKPRKTATKKATMSPAPAPVENQAAPSLWQRFLNLLGL